jgi:hypothetical protein
MFKNAKNKKKNSYKRIYLPLPQITGLKSVREGIVEANQQSKKAEEAGGTASGTKNVSESG